jgi:hypothetical protein
VTAPLAGRDLERLLAFSLAAPEARPLDQSLREFLEPRLRRSLGHVRIRTGPCAARAAAELRARAFAFGRDIVFARGEYAPHTERGLRLLVHEVAHVWQSATDGGRSGGVRLGPPDDRWEREAHRAADAVLAGAAPAILTPDTHRHVRRAVEFGDPEVTVIDHLTKPVISLRVGTTSTQVGFHMSAPWNPNNVDTNDALELQGGIRLRSGSPDDLREFQFGFVQFIRLPFLSLRYHGRKADEGHVLIDAQVEVGTGPMLDLNRRAGGVSPFYQRPFFAVVGGVVQTAMQDHPSLVVPQTLRNFQTGFDNHLEHASERLEAVSILTARHPTGRFQLFAHVKWTLLYDAAFSWNGAQIRVRLDNSQFDHGPVFTRAPRDSDLPGVSGLLGQLGPNMSPVFNDRLQAALRVVFADKRFTRIDSDKGHPQVPSTFWQ